MAKFYGTIGYVKTVETEPGMWEEQKTERQYSGELVKNTRRLEGSGGVKDNVNISNEVSTIADQYAYENFHAMRYIKFMGAKWKISNIEVRYPRLILTIGGVYNG